MSRMRAACRRKTRSLFENKESQKICGFSGFQFSREGGRSGNRHFAAVVLRPSRSDFKSEKREKCATATTAACGGCREELLGQRPAGCECRPRHEADAGSRNPCSFFSSAARESTVVPQLTISMGDDCVELFVLCPSLIGHAGVRTVPYTSLTTAPISLRMHSARGAISGGSWAGPGLMQT